MTQSNDVVGTVGVNFVESNTIDVGQGFNLNNDCDEEGDGNTAAACDTELSNLIGPVDQTNDVTGTNPNTAHTNNIEVSQTGTQFNACDESGVDAGTNDAQCNSDADNDIFGVSQENLAKTADNAAQTNDFSADQSSDLENNCDEFEQGSSIVNCDLDSNDNEVQPVSQSNQAFDSAGATISQNNEIDGDDALGIAGITQVIVNLNTCGQTGAGDNDATCESEGNDNFVDPIEQTNVVSLAGDNSIMTQDNRDVVSQFNSAKNDCDENTFNFVLNNNAQCHNNGDLDNFLGPLDQDNQVSSSIDNTLSDQDNNAAVSQSVTANNDCNGTGGNDVSCTNDGFDDGVDVDDFNFIAGINQSNGGAMAGNADQLNDLTLGQSGSLVNTCDETGGGVNQATCENENVGQIVGPISQANEVDADPNGDITTQSNAAQLTQNLDELNDCDEDGTGFNFASCLNHQITNEIESITQDNDALVGDDTVQQNFVAITQDLFLQNVCDETGIGDNAPDCNEPLGPTDSNNFVGDVVQDNDAAGSGDADFTQNNNIPTINQVIDAENDCDQSNEQTALGSNFADCSNDDPENTIDSITQNNKAQGTHVDDIFQDNTGSFSQVLTLNNGCDATTFTDNGDNSAECDNDVADNHMGNVLQTNTATGNDDVLI